MSASKFGAERNQKLLLELAIKPGNDICADCKTRNPRWASHNLGIFICVNCATIHRKIGTHVTKVKSLTMDTWTKEQVDRMKEMGNLNSNAIYCPNEIRHPPPADERDSEVESYIRSKYEYKRFLNRPGTTASSPSVSSPRPLNITSAASSSISASSLPRNTPSSVPTRSVSQPLNANPIAPQRQVSQPFVNAPPRQQSLGALPALSASSATSQAASASGANAEAKGGVWNDLVSLQAPSSSSSLPLQYSQSPMPTFNMSNPSFNPPNTLGMNGMNGLSPMNANPTGMSYSPFPQNMSGMSMPGTSFQQQQQQQFPQFTQLNQFGQPQGMMYNLQPQQQQQQPQPMYTNQLQPQLQAPQPMFAPQPGQMMGMPQGHSPQPMSTTPQLPGPYMSPSPQIPGMQMQQPQQMQMQSPQYGGMNPGMNGMPMNNGMGMNMGGMGMGGYPQQSQMYTGYGQSAPYGAQGQQWGSM